MSYRGTTEKERGKRSIWYVVGVAAGAALLAFIKSQTG